VTDVRLNECFFKVWKIDLLLISSVEGPPELCLQGEFFQRI